MGAVIIWQDGAVVVTSVNPYGPAGVSGEVLVGDHIVEVGGKAVTSVDQARALILGPGMSSLLLYVTPCTFGGCIRASLMAHMFSQWEVSSC